MFTIENGNRYLAQWDTGQRLIIDDREITEVHFAKGTNVAAVMQVTTEGDQRVVKVPNICLQLPNDLAVFFVITTPDGRSNTVHFSTIRVVRRPRPDDYVETEDEVLRWTTLASTIGSLTDLQTVEKTNLVAAINEVLKKVDTGGSIDPATIAQAVEDYLSENPVQEKDPTVPAWAKETEKPSYTAQEVGADASGTAAGLVAAHNTAEAAHNDIRLLISGLTDRLNALADSDDTTLDQLSEVVAYIKANRELIASITTDKVSVTDIVNNLVTNVANKPLSAAQGVALKALIDAITIPEKLPNPNALTFTGAATGSYDGSKPLTVNVPSLTVDDSLTQSGQAADAKATGDAISSLSSKIVTDVAAHNTGADTHSDIRLLISGLTDRLNALADSDDTTLDQLSEVVAYIKSNRTLIEAITTNKVSVADIVDNLTTNVANKPLSAAQGVALKALIDAISVPDKLPNPNALTFTGAATGIYDGSEPVTVNIPSGGGGGEGGSVGFDVLVDFTTEEAVTEFTIPETVITPIISKIKDASILMMQINIPKDGTDTSITTTGTVNIKAFVGWLTDIVGKGFNAIVAPSETSNKNWTKNLLVTKAPESVKTNTNVCLIQIFGKKNNSNEDSVVQQTCINYFNNFYERTYITVVGSQTMAAGTRFVLGVIA